MFVKATNQFFHNQDKIAAGLLFHPIRTSYYYYFNLSVYYVVAYSPSEDEAHKGRLSYFFPNQRSSRQT